MSQFEIMIPSAMENLQLPSPELLSYYQDLDKRIIWLDDEVNEYTLDIAKKIINWNREDSGKKIEKRKPIKILFFSPGGALDVNNTLIDIITLSETPVWGINMGRCCSAAAYIFLSCHKRFMLPKSYFLYHQGSGAFSGTYGEVCAQIEDYQTSIGELMEFMLNHTKYTQEELAEKIIGEWYIYPAEAIEKGVCDEIITSINTLL
jgi:ATP-dependent protease ClpP protease subunit